MTDPIAAANAASEESRAELRGKVAEAGDAYALAVDEVAELERRFAQDPDRDDVADEARAGRKRLDEARTAFDLAVKTQKAAHTKRVRKVLDEL